MANIYISADIGNDSTGTGTRVKPYLTVAKAYAVSTDGDTIVCMNSTATYSFTNVNFARTITVTGEKNDASGAVFDAALSVYRWRNNASDTVFLTIRNLTFQNITTSNSGTYRNIVSGTRLDIQRCVFRDIVQASSSGSSGAGGIVGSDYMGGAKDTDITISNNLFYNLTGGSPTLTIQLFSGGGQDYGTWKFNGNTVYADGTYTTPSYIVISTAPLVTLQMANNIFYSTTPVDMVAAGTAFNTFFDNNCTYNATSIPTGVGNITSDPLFVDKDNRNFNLRPSSLCIDAGKLL